MNDFPKGMENDNNTKRKILIAYWKEVTRSVPQGSVLAPTMFLDTYEDS